MARVDVKPEILLWAVNRSGNADIIEKKFPKLTEWLANISMPTLKQLEQLAKLTSTPLGYFFLSEPPIEQLTIPHYRTVKNMNTTHPSPDLIQTLHTMEQRQEWMRNYLIELGQDPLTYVGTVAISDDPKKIAKKMREKLDLVNGWASKCRTWEDALRGLIKNIEDIGILVMINGIVGNNTHRKLNVNEFRGFVLVDDYAPLIFINGADGKAAQMFTLAHELAHIWYGASAIFDLQKLQPSDDEIEQVCNQTAAEFLIPEKDLLFLWQSVNQESDRFQLIAREFKVSELVAVRRAMDLKLITRNEFFEFYQARQEKEFQNKSQKSDGGDFYATQHLRIGRKFAEAVITDTKEGKLLYRDAYRLTGLKGNTFTEFAERLESERYL